jgi:hypothetical protein
VEKQGDDTYLAPVTIATLPVRSGIPVAAFQGVDSQAPIAL